MFFHFNQVVFLCVWLNAAVTRSSETLLQTCWHSKHFIGPLFLKYSRNFRNKWLWTNACHLGVSDILITQEWKIHLIQCGPVLPEDSRLSSLTSTPGKLLKALSTPAARVNLVVLVCSNDARRSTSGRLSPNVCSRGASNKKWANQKELKFYAASRVSRLIRFGACPLNTSPLAICVTAKIPSF